MSYSDACWSMHCVATIGARAGPLLNITHEASDFLGFDGSWDLM
jgi:hypothetical protein